VLRPTPERPLQARSGSRRALAGRHDRSFMDDRLRSAPWRDLGITGRDVHNVPSMISPDEALYLYWLARCHYRGAGEIVDGGPLLGSSTIAFAEGLRLNDRVPNKSRRIHSYDLFQYTAFMKSLFRKRVEPPYGANLQPQFEANIAPWADSVRVYAGNILQYRWSGQPVEILFIDVAKTWEIQLHLLREFFASLIPGVSIVVQQDYFFVSTYWIHLVMEALSDYFRPIHLTGGPTLGFEVVAPVPRDLLLVDYEHAFSKDEAVTLLDRAHARFDGAKRLVATTAKVSLLLAHQDVDAAEAVLEEIRQSPDFGDAVQIDYDKAAERVAKASRRCRSTVSAASPALLTSATET
jgi:hypothetical protein